MADKEERIYICSKEKVCQICKDNCAEFDGIVPCGNCGYEDFPSMTRQEAIEKMAKGIHRYKKEGGLFVDGYAEAALNALLEGVKK